tara:strand:+ start:303 stop:497 length:195 start_codon:yes stop_codon:yes gene_type:complete
MLIFNSLEKKSNISILDNDIEKQGEFLYGTNYKVFLPKILKKCKIQLRFCELENIMMRLKKNIK